jgi:hypothetical protein
MVMRCFSRLSGIFGIVGVLVAGGAAPAVAQGFPMICRGGGFLSIANTAPNAVRISFAKASGPISAGLAPGQCTWVDRAIGATEPSRICDQASRAAGYAGGLLLNTNHITLRVFNNNVGCFVVSRVGY